MQELENNIEQQKRSTEEMKIRLDEERAKLKVMFERDVKYRENQKQNEEKIRELEKEIRRNRRNKVLRDLDSESGLKDSDSKDSDSCVTT